MLGAAAALVPFRPGAGDPLSDPPLRPMRPGERRAARGAGRLPDLGLDPWTNVDFRYGGQTTAAAGLSDTALTHAEVKEQADESREELVAVLLAAVDRFAAA